MEPSWLETYYTALEFIYWEPQHLGRKRNPDAELTSLDKIAKRLRRIEVTLNHNLDQFLRLAPTGLRNRLFGQVAARSFAAPFHMHGREVDKDFSLIYAMQPDFLFESETDVMSIEMKIDAKSSIAQVLKYALLGLAVELKRGARRQHTLLLLGRGDFSALWKEGYRDLPALKEAVASTDLQAFLAKQPVRFRPHLSDFTRIVQSLQVAYLSYQALAAFLRSEIPAESDGTSGGEVYRKLLSGMLGELSLRQLADA